MFGGLPPPAATHVVDFDAAVLGGVAGVVFGGVAMLGFDLGLTHATSFSLLPDLALWEHARYWWHAALGDAMGAHYHAWLAALQADGRYYAFLARLAGVFGLPTWLAFVAARKGLVERERFIHRAGRRLIEGHSATTTLQRMTAAECHADGAGLALHSSIRLSQTRETGNLLFMGTAGGGKTVTMKPFIWQAIARGDKAIIYDNKCEMTEEFPGPFILIAPWDARSAAIDIGADCRNKQDARELAAKFIPDSKDPMWSAAAQQIFTAMLIHLMTTKGMRWGWGDLADMVTLNNAAVKDIVHTYVPEADDAVADAEGKTTQSIMITMKSFCSVIFALAEAWRDQPGEKRRRRISFTRFVTDPTYRFKHIILQGSGRYQKMAQKVIGTILRSVIATMNSAECPDSKERRIWLFLDEFPQLGKIEDFNTILEVGRAKGFRTVIGAQDYNQIIQHYSKEECDTLLSQIKTTILVKLPAGPSAAWASELIGTRRVQVPQQSISSNTGMVDGGGSGSVSVSYNEVDLPVMHPADFETKLGKNSARWSGIRGLVIGWDDVFILSWPFVRSDKIRAAMMPAKWCVITPAEPEEGLLPPPAPIEAPAGGGEAMDPIKQERILAKTIRARQRAESFDHQFAVALSRLPPAGESGGAVLVGALPPAVADEVTAADLAMFDELNDSPLTALGGSAMHEVTTAVVDALIPGAGLLATLGGIVEQTEITNAAAPGRLGGVTGVATPASPTKAKAPFWRRGPRVSEKEQEEQETN